MGRFVPLLLAVGTVGLATCSPAQQNPWQQGSDFMQNAWKRVQAEGPAAAERFVRAAPDKFRQVKVQVSALRRNTDKWVAERRLDERRALLEELWRVRGSLDLMALLNPDVLHQLTGIDTKTLREMRAQVDRVQTALKVRS